ncbi:Uncoordinated 43-like protein [Cladobotryum mycophilum]|uniref:Uncoordinated 43-like protein n=1 Tax=Cladobotryum mycophilum TaxID=491253 RepID=A0ABR0SXA8_9HYPO
MATRIVKANPRFVETAQGEACLSFQAGQRSKFTGRLVSIGRLSAINDVVLPEDGGAQLQCSFYFVPSGELMLEDSTQGHATYIDWYDEDGKVEKYSLQGIPRRRITPRAPARKIQICFGQKVTFQLKWQISVDPARVEKTRQNLVALANVNSNPDHFLNVPRNPNLDPTAYEPRTHNTPIIPKEYDGKPLRQIHIYQKLGEGVLQSNKVDLERDDWKAEVKREVEELAQVQHPGIIRFEHHQGWSPGRQVQIFLKLCHGNAFDLLSSPHECNNPIPDSCEPWFLAFVDQILGALGFIHKKGMIHRDLKPENILYDKETGGHRYSFYISDFGLAISKGSAHQHPVGGTRGYIAPEGVRYGEKLVKSDIYSMGIIVLEIFDIYCQKGRRFTEREWQDKLKANGARNYRDHADRGWRGVTNEAEIVYSRLQSLTDHKLIDKGLRYMLEQDPKDRSTASEARRDLMDYCKKAMGRERSREAEPRQRDDRNPRIVTVHPHRRDHEEHQYVNVDPPRRVVEPAEIAFDFRDGIRPPLLKRRTTNIRFR